MSELGPEKLKLPKIPKNPRKLARHLKEIDYTDPMVYLPVIGAAALAVGVGVAFKLKNGEWWKVTHPDRHAEKQGVVSVLQTGIGATDAMSATTKPEALDTEKDGAGIFIMGDGTKAYPLRQKLEDAHRAVLNRATHAIAELLVGRDAGTSVEIPPRPDKSA